MNPQFGLLERNACHDLLGVLDFSAWQVRCLVSPQHQSPFLWPLGISIDFVMKEARPILVDLTQKSWRSR